MFSAILVDDERPALTLLERMLRENGEIRVLASFTSAEAALDALRTLRPDVAFLDIEMPGMRGLELAEKILETGANPEIVFVTAYDKYALDAFRVSAIDYILKPLSPDDIARSVARLEKLRYQPGPAGASGKPPRVHCFGRLAVYGPGLAEPIRWRTAKTEELFAFLLDKPDSEVPRWQITQALWPDCETEKQESNNLHTTVYRLKKALMTFGIPFELGFAGGAYKLSLPGASLDTAEFDAAVRDSGSIAAGNQDRFIRAFRLYRGNYLEENAYLWSQFRAEHYLAGYRRLTAALAAYYRAARDEPAAEQVLRDALAVAPLDDELNAQLLRLLLEKRDKTGAVLHYAKLRELYLEELGIAPGEPLQALYHRALNL